AMKRGLPKHVSRFKDRHGTWRLRARAKGRPGYYFKAPFGTPEFEIELQDWRDGAPRVIGVKRTAPGSVSDMIARYYKSTTWASLSPGSQKGRRSILERFRNEHGEKPIKALQRSHIQAII